MILVVQRSWLLLLRLLVGRHVENDASGETRLGPPRGYFFDSNCQK